MPMDVCRLMYVLGCSPIVPHYTADTFIVWIYTVLFIGELTDCQAINSNFYENFELVQL